MIEWTFRLAICQRQTKNLWKKSLISEQSIWISVHWKNTRYRLKILTVFDEIIYDSLMFVSCTLQNKWSFYQSNTNTHLVHTGISWLMVFFILIILVSLTATATAWGITDGSGSLLLRVGSRSGARLWKRIKKAFFKFCQTAEFIQQQYDTLLKTLCDLHYCRCKKALVINLHI